MSSVHQHIGVCPQFDIQHSSLTAKEVCLFDHVILMMSLLSAPLAPTILW